MVHTGETIGMEKTRTTNQKDKIAIYSQTFLSPSMTFIHNQTVGVSEVFHPLVLTSFHTNRSRFPHRPVYEKRKSALDRYLCWLFRKTGAKYAVWSPAQERYFKTVLEQNNVSLIHAHFGPAALEVMPVAKKLGIPLIVTFHGYDASSLLSNKIYRINVRELIDYAETICVSDFFRNKILELGGDPARVHTHYIGISTDFFSFRKRELLKNKIKDGSDVVCLQVSNFVEKKGHKYTVEAFSRLLKSHKNVKLLLAGDGPLIDDVRSQVKSLGIDDSVEFVGRVDSHEVQQLMADADLFLHHSVTAQNGDMEGIPTVIMEAMACGLPVVSSNHSGIPELITSGCDGLLVNEKDVDGYVEALMEMLRSEQDFGASARKIIENKFNLEIQNQELVILYRDVMRNV